MAKTGDFHGHQRGHQLAKTGDFSVATDNGGGQDRETERGAEDEFSDSRIYGLSVFAAAAGPEETRDDLLLRLGAVAIKGRTEVDSRTLATWAWGVPRSQHQPHASRTGRTREARPTA
jgi:hypothetical protein